MSITSECTVDWEVRTRVVTRTIIGIRRIARKERKKTRRQEDGEDGEWRSKQCMWDLPANGQDINLAVYSDYYCSVPTDLTVQQVLGDVLMDADEQWRSS
jgi:hypothetical protein